jgi:catechol 2,3-dioxygenase-like lactoylglutathione lyase family enzyme
LEESEQRHARQQHPARQPDGRRPRRRRRLYTDVLGLTRAPTPPLDFPAQFIAVDEYQQIHLNRLDDVTPERAHFCMRVADFNGVYRRAKEAGVIETKTWGHARRLASGVMQVFVRDPAGNLIEIACDPDQPVDEDIFNDEAFSVST